MNPFCNAYGRISSDGTQAWCEEFVNKKAKAKLYMYEIMAHADRQNITNPNQKGGIRQTDMETSRMRNVREGKKDGYEASIRFAASMCM